MPQNTDNHAFYLTQIHQLKELQKLDDQIYEVQQILEKAPDELRDLQDKLTKAEVQRDRINDKISHLKELGFKRIPFPKRATAISVIHSKSHAANVFADFKNELDLKSVNVESLPTAMTDPSAIARAIDQASGNVVVLIRGGGDDAEFTTFQHDDVVKALARKAAHRITGLGHYGNLTYADIIADFCTTTPTSAGAYVREQLIRTYNMRQTEREALEEQAALIKALRISKLKWMLVALAGVALAGYLGFFR
jgi:uncharacterized coiled-coil protein SlyX